jgi:FixJ family two-component response regulator
LFEFIVVDQLSLLDDAELARVEPGFVMMLEVDAPASIDDELAFSHHAVQRILRVATAPVVLCVGHRVSAEVVVEWMRAGIFSYVEQTASDQHLRRTLEQAAAQSKRVSEQHLRYEKLLQLWSNVTDREASVLDMLMEGLPNKKIATRLGVSQRTIEARRQKLYEKLESRSVVDVVRTIYELDSLEHLFHRKDASSKASPDQLPKAPKFLGRLPHFLRASWKSGYREASVAIGESSNRSSS